MLQLRINTNIQPINFSKHSIILKINPYLFATKVII